MTWVGYDDRVDNSHLPPLRKAVISASYHSGLSASNLGALKHINQLYARDYRVTSDLQFIITGIRDLGGNS